MPSTKGNVNPYLKAVSKKVASKVTKTKEKKTTKTKRINNAKKENIPAQKLVKCLICNKDFDGNNQSSICSVEHDYSDWECGIDIVGMIGWTKQYRWSRSCTICGESHSGDNYYQEPPSCKQGYEYKYDTSGYCYRGKHATAKLAVRKIAEKYFDESWSGHEELEDTEDEEEDSEEESDNEKDEDYKP